MTLPPETYLSHIRDESDRLRAALAACDPATRVPTCPEWTAADLLQHLTGVQTFWAQAIEQRPAEPRHHEVERAATPAVMVADSVGATDRLVALLAAHDPDDEVWNWSEDHTARFLLRRQAHEAAIHRVDAESAAGARTPLDPILAADGVHEVLDVMFGGGPAWGRFTPLEQHVRVDLVDVDTSVWVALGSFTGTNPENGRGYTDQPDLRVVADPGVEPDVVVDGTAETLDLWLWGRGDDAHVHVGGDRTAYERFRGIVGQPID